ncbi:hypothetical protein HS041_36945 [Planomonospora sp. ID67723]|uniref:hypothetical protein n=1 Tax=Planomonospora sp. ID67723 TaxID=2738134 RepID=UPI0018C43DE2|nr:hypothetical protein [Planomonospora sp. ID67723]MBG0833292.1 hypothetical protein [Planomonospora sp. ID67723]
MYANSALAFTGTGMSVAASTALPSASDLALPGTAAADLTTSAVETARVMLMVTGAGFGLFLLAMVALLAAGAVLRGAAAGRRLSSRGDRDGRRGLAPRDDRHGLTARVTR